MTNTPSLECLAQAARPTLFDVACRPELLIALTFANLMSPALWELCRHIHERYAGHDPAAVLGAIHDYVNRKFTHVSLEESRQFWGAQDLAADRARLGTAHVDYVLDVLARGFHKLGATGGESALRMIESGRFPEYRYAILDIVEAHSPQCAEPETPAAGSVLVR